MKYPLELKTKVLKGYFDGVDGIHGLERNGAALLCQDHLLMVLQILSSARSFPSMPICIPQSCSTERNSSELNWLPWSLLKILGTAYFRIAYSKAATQKLVSIVFDSCHDSTFLEQTSMMLTKHTVPHGDSQECTLPTNRKLRMLRLYHCGSLSYNCVYFF